MPEIQKGSAIKLVRYMTRLLCVRKSTLAMLSVFTILAMSASFPAGAKAGTLSAGDFVYPKQIANPQTPDQEFFNMRLQYFLPESEPLIKQTFGSALQFDNSAFWEYSSYYSRAVSFATNLPTVAKIEYGPDTNYGSVTKQSESFFYQHLLYLTGLEPDKTYHYRIGVMGSDGTVLSSDDHVFTTPALTPNVIRIPQDLPNQSAPYTLATENAKYLLTQDLTAPNGGIVISASNVELDLGGHTISYDNAPNPLINESKNTRADFMYGVTATFGIRSGLWNLTGQKIFNGAVVQGKNGGSGVNGTGYNPIYSTHTSNLEIAGVTADYYGANVNGIDADNNNYIHNNVVYDRGIGIDDRHMQMRAITSNIAAGNVTACNSVRRSRQTAISTGGQQNGNEVYGDSYSTNSFLINYANNSTSAGNKLFGLGYMVIGIGGGDMHDAAARNNFIYLNAYSPAQRFTEYDRTSGVTGFRPQIYASSTGPFNNNLFENNVVVCKAWPGSSYIRALWVCSDVNQNNMIVRNNTVKAETMTDGINFNDANYSYACLEYQGSSAQDATPPVLFTDNTFIANTNFIAFGSGYGIGKYGSFYNTTFQKIDHNSGFFTPFRIGFWDWNSTNNKIIDSIAGPGVDLSAPVSNITTNTEPDLSVDIGVSSQRAYVNAATGAALANTTVSWVTDGGDRGDFTTDAKGEAYCEWITTHNRHKPGDPGRSMSQVKNTAVTFTIAGYDPVAKSILDIQGAGSAIRFGNGSAATAAPTPIVTPKPTAVASPPPTATPKPTATPSAAPKPTATPSATPKPTATPTAAPKPTATLTAAPKPTATLKPTSTATPMPTSTPTIPAANSNLTVQSLSAGPEPGSSAIHLLFWCASEFDGAEIYRSTSPSGPFQLAQTKNGQPAYSDTGLSPVTTYYYQVRVFKGGQFGPMSGVVSVKTGDIVALGLSCAPGAASGSVYLNLWSYSVFDGTEIYRSDTQNGDYQLVKTESGQPAYYDSGLKANTTYYYKVRLFKDGYFGPMSDAVAAKSK